MELSPKLRFKLERWKNSLDALFAGKESYDTSHRMCPNCRALVERGASECPFCGMKLRSPRARSQSSGSGQVLGGLLPVPSTACSVIILVTIAVYAASWYLTQQASSPGMPAPSMGGINGGVLQELGAKSPLIVFRHQWWRLVTAIFLHAGLFHIGMNLWCLFDLGPQVEALFGASKFVVFYLVTGVAGFLLSLFWNPMGMSIGASGAILGLIGVLIGASFHHGGLGKAYRGTLWRWVIYILIFGLLPFFAVDNAAHIGGLVSGLALGYVVPETDSETVMGDKLWNVLALFAVIIIAGSFVLMAMHLTQAGG
ncbi:MAG TPA: rhomboid family intramembrane serine protease [Terriglobia bacterium]|nr:rhomboid family intramembrane serine protease [Terriglobia bacterium]